jgi:hypothetical protein
MNKFSHLVNASGFGRGKIWEFPASGFGLHWNVMCKGEMAAVHGDGLCYVIFPIIV